MTDDHESNNPDRMEKGIRLGCGATFGFLFSLSRLPLTGARNSLGRQSPSPNFGPLTMRRLFASGSIQDQIDATTNLVLSELFLAVPAVLAIIVIHGIHRRQEQRFQVVGPHLADPVKAAQGEQGALSQR